jgi:hypothetical protein
MKLICGALAVLCFSVLLVSGCTDVQNPSALEKTTIINEGTTLFKSSGPSANGQATLILDGGRQTFSFHAREKKNGSVSGSVQAKSRGQDLGFHGDVDCFTVVGGNTAVIGGVLTQVRLGPNPAFIFDVGDRFWFKVTDNGEGANSPGDEFTDVGILTNFPDVRCEEFPPFSGFLPFLPIVKGNVQVIQ